jgi:hypothetical protein
VNAEPTWAIPISASSDADSASRALPSGAPGSLVRCRAPLFITAHRSAWAIPLAVIQQYRAWTPVSPQRGASTADVSTIVRNPIGLEATWETMSSVRPLARAIRCSSSIVSDRDVEGLPAISVHAGRPGAQVRCECGEVVKHGSSAGEAAGLVPLDMLGRPCPAGLLGGVAWLGRAEQTGQDAGDEIWVAVRGFLGVR